LVVLCFVFFQVHSKIEEDNSMQFVRAVQENDHIKRTENVSEEATVIFLGNKISFSNEKFQKLFSSDSTKTDYFKKKMYSLNLERSQGWSLVDLAENSKEGCMFTFNKEVGQASSEKDKQIAITRLR